MSTPFITLILVPGKTLIELDAVVSESHQGEVEVTEHPVEVGANVSDHARVKPETLTIEGLISNTPVNSGQHLRVINAGGVEIETTATEDAIEGAAGYAETAFAKLKELKDSRQLVTVATQMRTYKNMMLTSVSVPRDSRTGDALRFTVSFKEVRFAEVRRTEVASLTTEPKTKKKVKTGENATPPTPEEKRKSIAKKLHESATNPNGTIHKFVGQFGVDL